MATYRDPVRCFAPLEVLERLLEIRAEAGFAPAVYLLSPDDLAIISTLLASMCTRFLMPRQSFISETIERRWRRVVIMPTVR
jgi:hypothetical protein